MRSRLAPIAFLSMLVVGSACAPKTMSDRVTVERPVIVPGVGAPASVHLDVEAAVHAIQVRHWNETVLVNAMVANAAASGPVSTHTSSPTRTGVAADGYINDVPCGGDLPPCSRVQIESGGTWDAFNNGGCGGNNCYGPYQFSGAWAGKLGLPLDLTTTTHEQWVAAARELWNHGAGCSNWAC